MWSFCVVFRFFLGRKGGGGVNLHEDASSLFVVVGWQGASDGSHLYVGS